MSIGAGVVVAVALHEVHDTPDCETCAQSDNESLKNTYGRITSVKDGTTFEWIATAENGWHAIVVNAQIGWVSGKYSKTIE